MEITKSNKKGRVKVYFDPPPLIFYYLKPLASWLPSTWAKLDLPQFRLVALRNDARDSCAWSNLPLATDERCHSHFREGNGSQRWQGMNGNISFDMPYCYWVNCLIWICQELFLTIFRNHCRFNLFMRDCSPRLPFQFAPFAIDLRFTLPNFPWGTFPVTSKVFRGEPANQIDEFSL